MSDGIAPLGPIVGAESADASWIGQQAARGAASFAARSAVVYGLQIVGSLVLARRLTPADYGTAALGLSMTGALRYIGDLGASTALVQMTGKAELRRSLQEMAMFIHLAVAFASCLSLIAAAAAAFALFNQPAASIGIAAALGSTLVIESFGTPADVRLRRRLAFGRLGVIDVLQSVVLYGVQIALLLAGAGVWAVVFAVLARSTSASLLRIVSAGAVAPRRHVEERDLLRRSLSFQAGPIAIGVVGFVTPVLVGALLEPTELGLWLWSTALAAPIMAIVPVASQVGFPALSRLNADASGALQRGSELLVRTTSLVAVVAVGSVFGLVDPIIRIVFDDRWSSAVGASRAFLVTAVLMAWFVTLVTIVTATGDPMTPFRAVIAGGVATAVTLVPLTHVYGVAGAAIASGVVGTGVQVVVLLRRSDVRLGATAARGVTVVVTGAVVGGVLSSSIDSLGSLALAGATAATASVAVALVVDLVTVRTGFELLRRRI